MIGCFAFWLFDIFGILCLVAENMWGKRPSVCLCCFGLVRCCTVYLSGNLLIFVSLGFNDGEF